MPETNRELAARWFEEVWNQQRRDAIGEMLADGAPVHEGGITVHGPEGFYAFFDRMQAAFSNIHVTVKETLAEGDKVCVRWSCSLKHTGAGLGMAPTGKIVETTGITIIRVAGDKFVEAWQNWDMLGIMQQIQDRGLAATYIGASSS
jgi:predicted ester cyclase